MVHLYVPLLSFLFNFNSFDGGKSLNYNSYNRYTSSILSQPLIRCRLSIMFLL